MNGTVRVLYSTILCKMGNATVKYCFLLNFLDSVPNFRTHKTEDQSGAARKDLVVGGGGE